MSGIVKKIDHWEPFFFFIIIQLTVNVFSEERICLALLVVIFKLHSSAIESYII